MNLRQTVGLAFKAGLLGLLLIVCLGSDYLHRDALRWPLLNQVWAVVIAMFQQSDGQWLIVSCVSVYLVGFLWLNPSLKREVHFGWKDGTDVRVEMTPRRSDEVATSSPASFRKQIVRGRPEAPPGAAHSPFGDEASPLPGRDVAVIAGIALFATGGLTYALQYDQASKSSNTLLLCFGITLHFGFRFWRAIEVERTRPFNLASVVLAFTLILLVITTVWHSESIQSFEYRGQARWSGLWDNPNTFGVLMGVGVALSAGLIMSHVMRHLSSDARETARHLTPALSPAEAERGTEHPTLNPQAAKLNVRSFASRVTRCLPLPLLLAAGAICGVGLVRSYSRGAWVGALAGLSYLVWERITHLTRTLTMDTSSGLRHLLPSGCGECHRGGEGDSHSAHAGACGSRIPRVSRLMDFARRNWLPASVLLASVLMLAFWNMRHTERLVVRRATSVANANDFSWRKRAAAWEGTLQMMADKPLLGFGWNQPQRVYDQFYRTPKVDEGAAIQLNDYFTLGTTLGIPALACFVAFIGLSLTRNPEHETRNTQTAALRPLTSDLWLPSVCRAAAIVLLVGFWFDGGLFKLATGATFWILLELGREAILGPGLLEVAPNANQIETRSLI